MNDHQHGEDNEMQSGQSFREPFVVAREPSKAVEPTEAAFNHPSSGQKNGSLFGLRQLDDPQFDTFIARGPLDVSEILCAEVGIKSLSSWRR